MRKLDFIFHVLLIMILFVWLLIDWKQSIFFILIAQFFVGVYQVISSALRTFRFSAFDPTVKKLIVLYWISCLVYFLGLQALYFIWLDHDYINYYFYSAWGIAFYYCYITYLLAFPKYTKSHLDI